MQAVPTAGQGLRFAVDSHSNVVDWASLVASERLMLCQVGQRYLSSCSWSPGTGSTATWHHLSIMLYKMIGMALGEIGIDKATRRTFYRPEIQQPAKVLWPPAPMPCR